MAWCGSTAYRSPRRVPWGCAQGHVLALTGDQATLSSGGRIDVTAAGGPGARPGTTDRDPAPSLKDAAGTTIHGSAGWAGGSYGGRGGLSTNGTGRPNIVFGSSTHPIDFGRGGGGAFQVYGFPGGGLLKVDVQSLDMNGVIAADGGQVLRFDPAAGGSGGGVWIDAGTLSGDGLITASGGDGCGADCVANVWAGGGGGGRVAIRYGTKHFTGTIRVAPGRSGGDETGHPRAKAGTVAWVQRPEGPVDIGSVMGPIGDEGGLP
jgi:hypothetical protein